MGSGHWAIDLYQVESACAVQEFEGPVREYKGGENNSMQERGADNRRREEQPQEAAPREETANREETAKPDETARRERRWHSKTENTYET